VIHSQSTVNAYRDNFPKDAESLLRPRAADMLSVHVHGGELVVPPGRISRWATIVTIRMTAATGDSSAGTISWVARC